MESVQTHLVHKIPHGEIDALIEDATNCKTASDIEALYAKISFISKKFAAAVHEFRSSVLASERKRKVEKPHLDMAVPLAGASQGLDVAPGEIEERLLTMPLDEIKRYDGDGYDHRPSALTTLIVHDRLPALRVMIDKGLDLRRFWRMMSHVGGGLQLLRDDNLWCYIWLNQALLHGWSPVPQLPDVNDPTRKVGFGLAHVDAQARKDPKTFRRLLASSCLQEYINGYDNRNFRRAKHIRIIHEQLADGSFDLVALRSLIKDHIFPEIVRTSHMFQYNQMVHERKSTPPAALEDPNALAAEPYDVENAVAGILAVAIGQLLDPKLGFAVSGPADTWIRGRGL
mmetsp:Transcript_38959/g.91959  ORF Transcript_38959/g.91959 Transcript_38959/m.91959 type:complete len:342 (+) Transcript_38959:221-1246(+)|eukprot:CAMPEP_0177716318 /NCGR_PEP_ID=MMETSP0484_2-20121128/14451_1 /TAXON_ID=354590 /ORGANISM="Rhodomonas lens, Strain RHODO" /LENGTH=341 /DNA_ID=CAMNT_0019228351 /DNA_START=168 /DNA_END=1193 /DNA_ORIENTATION=+